MVVEGISSSIVSSTMKQDIVPVEYTPPQNVIKPVTAKDNSYESNKDGSNQQKEGARKDLSEVEPAKIKEAVEEMNKKIMPIKTHCEFKFIEDTNRIAITIKNSDTDEIIKEIPSEKTLAIIAKSIELAGLIIDEKR